MKKKSFVLPKIPVDKYADDTNGKVLVISFFGKSPYNATGCKTGILGEFPGCTMFQPSLLDEPVIDKELLCKIEGHYDMQKKIIFLHLRGIYDTYHLVQVCEQMSEDLQEKGFLSLWSDVNCRYTKALLFLFSVSHILVLSQPSSNFDLSYKQLFRALDIVRQKAQPLLSELLLSAVPQLPADWALNARPCSPRVLFVFESCPPIFTENAGTNPLAVHSRSFGNVVGLLHTDLGDQKSKPSVKRLEHALEDQIYHVLRKSRVVTNTCTNSLFAIPANEEFVFVCVKPDPSRDYMAHLINSLVEQCSTATLVPRSEDPFNLRHPDTKEHTFKNFIQPHIDQAFSKGFDDNVGRHVTPAYFEMVSAAIWGEIVNVVWNFFMTESTESEKGQASVFTCLNSVLHTDLRFSEERCSKVLPVASATYQENLPQHYPRDYHETMLAHALNVFSVHARGPLFEQYVARLAEECEAHWKAGRQVCEVLSLTGNPCTNPLHRGGGEGAGGGELQAEDNNIDRQLPVMNHLSGVRYVSACNCGRKQGPREDPFSAKEANYDFYVQLGEECGCARLESFKFPVFQPSTQDFKAAQLFSRTGRKEGPKSPEGRDFPVPGTPLGNTQSFSLGQSAKLSAHDSTPEHASQSGFVSGQSGGSDLIQEEVTSHLSCNPPRDTSPPEGHEIIIQVSDSESESSKDKFLVRQPSTTEYLPGMLHTESPLGLLPQYPSWSLVCLGPSSLYSHNLGLQEQQQAGLLGGSAHLLPWDVTVRLQQHRERCWPAVGDQMYSSRGKTHPGVIPAGTRSRKPKPPNKDSSEFVVKIFVGVEYECPRGHRFMCSAPDKVLKTSGMGLVKDTGNRVTSSDMPLYCPCPCRSAKPLVAQLMRIHVVTPKAPVHVTLNPRVQPALHSSPIFVTGSDQPLRLSQSAYWVLRLPYVYVGDHGPFIPPKDPVPPGYGRLLAGMYSITEQPPQE